MCRLPVHLLLQLVFVGFTGRALSWLKNMCKRALVDFLFRECRQDSREIKDAEGDDEGGFLGDLRAGCRIGMP